MQCWRKGFHYPRSVSHLILTWTVYFGRVQIKVDIICCRDYFFLCSFAFAEAISDVLPLQAARKYDIPYPTFVLYANRVHNLLGPSQEPGDMRPKGRGRPQRILLGSWPEEQIKGVIRAVVFRDTSVFKDSEHKVGRKTKVQSNSTKAYVYYVQFKGGILFCYTFRALVLLVL